MPRRTPTAEAMAEREAVLCHPLAYEEAMAMLGRFIRVANDAKRAAITLDDKVRYQRHASRLEEARRILRLGLFDYQDAHRVAATAERCEGCGEVQYPGTGA